MRTLRTYLLNLGLCAALVSFGLTVFGQSARPGRRPVSNLSLWTSCETCHVTASWNQIKPSVHFQHAITGFPLFGRHKQALCNQCHNTSNAKNRGRVRGHFSGKQKRIRACNACHSSPHNQTVSRDCQRCHNTRTWKRTQGFLQHQRTHFPLTGAHASLTCNACHIHKEQSKFRKLPTRCGSCHARDYVRPGIHPDHKVSGFGMQCQQCHTTFAWKPAKVNHNLFWPLVGAHLAVSCSRCHVRNRYKGTPKDCYSCHQKDYTRAGHTSSAYSTNCLDCHSQTAWKPASFANHDRVFPISRGNHSGFQCSQCHTTAAKRGSFTCLAPCHTKARMDKEHIGEVAGYVYESRKCLTCHPQGTE